MKENYIDVPFIKYPDSEHPVIGRYLCPEGHKYYAKPFDELIKECVDQGLINQGRLWDAYDKCSIDVVIYKAVK